MDEDLQIDSKGYQMMVHAKVVLLLVTACFLLCGGCLSSSHEPSAGSDAKYENPKKHFVNSMGMKLIFVKARSFGAFTPSFADFMKAVTEVSGGLERPPIPHQVTLPNDYYLAEFPVTNKIYRRFVKETDHREPGGEMYDIDRVRSGGGNSYTANKSTGSAHVAWELAGFTADNQPVTGISPSDAMAFCQWMSKSEGRKYRLAEVYEWEYACRAGTDTLFHWGDRPDPRYMNYASSRIGHPTPVGLYPPNKWGFYDMHGNVAECCEQIGRPGGVQKGGAWNYPAGLTGADVYTDIRGTFTPHLSLLKRRTMEIGLRLACDASEAKPRPGDLGKATVLAAGGEGPAVPKLEITLGEEMDLGWRKTSGLAFLATQSGAWLLNNMRSDDQGKTWKECNGVAYNHIQLRDGTIMSCGSTIVMSNGAGSMSLQVSTDDWNTVEQRKATVHVPLGKRFIANGGMLELDDGSILMGLYGVTDLNQVIENNPLFPLVDEAYKTLVILVKSTDRAKSWHYLSTINYHPEMGREGANETWLVRLPSGDMFAPMRTGLHGYVDPLGRAELDEPMLVTWSRCDGKSWGEPSRIYVKDKLVSGIWPRAAVTQTGVLALLRSRPDASVVFSPDGTGTIWTDEVKILGDGEGGSMHAMDLIGPDTVLVIYIAKFDRSKERYAQLKGLPITVKIRNR